MGASPVGGREIFTAAQFTAYVNEFKRVDKSSFFDFKHPKWVIIKLSFKADTSGIRVDFLPVNW